MSADGFVRSIFTAEGFFDTASMKKSKFRLNLIAVDKSFPRRWIRVETERRRRATEKQ